MIRLIGLAVSIGLADSMNPSTIAPGLYLAMRPVFGVAATHALLGRRWDGEGERAPTS